MLVPSCSPRTALGIETEAQITAPPATTAVIRHTTSHVAPLHAPRSAGRAGQAGDTMAGSAQALPKCAA